MFETNRHSGSAWNIEIGLYVADSKFQILLKYLPCLYTFGKPCTFPNTEKYAGFQPPTNIQGAKYTKILDEILTDIL